MTFNGHTPEPLVREVLPTLRPATDEYPLTGDAPLACQETVPSFSNAL